MRARAHVAWSPCSPDSFFVYIVTRTLKRVPCSGYRACAMQSCPKGGCRREAGGTLVFPARPHQSKGTILAPKHMRRCSHGLKSDRPFATLSRIVACKEGVCDLLRAKGGRHQGHARAPAHHEPQRPRLLRCPHGVLRIWCGEDGGGGAGQASNARDGCCTPPTRPTAVIPLAPSPLRYSMVSSSTRLSSWS